MAGQGDVAGHRGRPKDKNRTATIKPGLQQADFVVAGQLLLQYANNQYQIPVNKRYLFDWKCSDCKNKTNHSGFCRFNPRRGKAPSRNNQATKLNFAASSSTGSSSSSSSSASTPAAASASAAPSHVPSDADDVEMVVGTAAAADRDVLEPTLAPAADADDDPFNAEEAEEPNVVETIKEVPADVMAPLDEYVEKLKEQLPKMKGPLLREESKNWRENNPMFFSDFIPIPSAFLTFLPVAVFIVLRFASLIFFDIGMFYPKFFPEKLKCPNCGKCGKFHRKGFLHGYVVVSGLDPSSNWLVKPVTYEHKGCKPDGGNSQFSALHPDVWKQYDKTVHDMYPFTPQKFPIKRSVETFALAAKDKGVADRAMEKISATMCEDHLLQSDKMCLGALTSAAKKKLTLAAVKAPAHIEMPSVTFTNSKFVRSIGRNVWARIIANKISMLLGIWIAFTLLLPALSLAIDHTFWICTASLPFIALFSALSPHGHIVFTRFVRNKGHESIEPQLEVCADNLNENNYRFLGKAFTDEQSSVGVVSTDAPHLDKLMIGRVFGPMTKVQADLFHMYQQLYREMKGRPERKIVMRELGKAAVRVVEEDVALVADLLIAEWENHHRGESQSAPTSRVQSMPQPVAADFCEEGSPSESFRKRVADYVSCTYRKFRGKIRTAVRPKEALASAWTSIFNSQKRSHPGLFKRTFDAVWSNVLGKINGGMLDDLAYDQLYINVGTESNPRYIVARGTSKLEAMHAAIRKMFSAGSYTVKTLLYLMHLFVFSNNINVQRNVMKKKMGKHTLDALQMDEIVGMIDSLKASDVHVTLEGHVLADWYVTTAEERAKPWYQVEAEFTQDDGDSALEKACKAVGGGGVVVQHGRNEAEVLLEQAKTGEREKNPLLGITANQLFGKNEEKLLVGYLMCGMFDPKKKVEALLKGPFPEYNVLRSLFPTSRGVDGNVSINSDLKWEGMADHYAIACVNEKMNPSSTGMIHIVLNNTEYTVPSSEAKSKGGDVFEKWARMLATRALYTAANTQYEAARLVDGVESVPRTGLSISANAEGNEFLLAPAPLPFRVPTVPTASPQPIVVDVTETISADSSAVATENLPPLGKCVTCDFMFDINGHGHSNECKFGFIMSKSDFNKTNVLSILKTELMSGYTPYYNKRKNAPSGESSSLISKQQWAARQWGSKVKSKHGRLISSAITKRNAAKAADASKRRRIGGK